MNKYRERRKNRIKKKIFPLKKYSLCVFRSNKNFYFQVLDLNGNTIFSTNNFEIIKSYNIKSINRSIIIKMIAKNLSCKLFKNGINNLVFNRNGYSYDGNIKKIINYIKSYGIKI